MLTTPMDVQKQFPVRKSKKQKQSFRDAVQAYAQILGYTVCVEKGSMGAQNVVIGNPDKAKYLVTAHYDTPANMILPNFLTPTNLLVYIAYQLFIVALLFAVSYAAVWGIGWLLGADTFHYFAWWLLYMVLLMLLSFGPANRHNANDNSSGVIALLETMAAVPDSYKDQACFVLFDLEEAGLIGSSSYRKAHKQQTDRQTVVNLDCVGDGNEFLIFPSKKLNKDPARLLPIAKLCGYWGKKSMVLRRKGISIYPSDQINFPYAVGIAAFHRKPFIGPYHGRIHTCRDTVLDRTNIHILRAAITTLICQ